MWLERFRLSGVESCLEVPPDGLTTREHRLVADAPRRQLHDPDVVVPVAVAARVCGGLIEGPKAVALPLSPHVSGGVAEGGLERNLRARRRAALCDEKPCYQAAERQLHGLQSPPERTKYRRAAVAWSWADAPCPNRRRSCD